MERQGELHGEIEDEVRRLLEQGQSWTVVADAIGISRQGARQRYRHLATGRVGATIGIDGAGGRRREALQRRDRGMENL